MTVGMTTKNTKICYSPFCKNVNKIIILRLNKTSVLSKILGGEQMTNDNIKYLYLCSKNLKT